MKSLKLNIQILAVLLVGMAILFTGSACNPKKSSSETTTFEEKPSTTVLPTVPTKDTVGTAPASPPTSSTTAAPSTPKPGKESDGVTVYPTPAPKVCQPNFKMIGKPKGNHYLFYLTGFIPGEFKCWNLVEEHAVSICNGQPCVIYYVDDPNGSMSAPPPNYVDPKYLKQHGLGQFSHDENWWEMKGSKIWGREGKQYLYFNTNNNSGG
jgi:hypothetical protein